MIGINHFWAKGSDGIGGIAHSHREWNIYENESDVDVRQRAHFRNISGVTAGVDAPATDGQHVPIAGAQRMIRVIGWYGFNSDAHEVRGVAIREHDCEVPLRSSQAAVN